MTGLFTVHACTILASLMSKTLPHIALAVTALVMPGCRQKEGFYVKSFDSKSGKLVLIRYKTNTTITASCLSTRDMKDNTHKEDAFDEVCMDLPSHVGETIKEGNRKGQIDKTIAL